ncbi:LytR C-terminal domain-containing protein [Kribbia dieselivorans]|uniref:LytR C-terminal domain-containing protein n=1 Tax=Kribbia dieselivorans TaxID=331526 RepID=UPI000838927F|nr:LytR C-terminal domain-containing protein [Kribbia dieselivorans]
MADETLDLAQAGQSRRRRTLIAVGLIVLVAFWVFWYLRSYWVEDGAAGRSAAAEQTCPPAPAPAKVRINVYNATAQAGLAATVAQDLREHGFQVGTVGNASTAARGEASAPTGGPAILVHGSAGTDAARTVARWVADGTRRTDGRSDSTVDLVLGEGFTRVRSAPAPLCP